MKRPILVITIGYIIGIVWGLYCKCSIALLYALILSIYFIQKLYNKPKGKFKLFSFKRYFRYLKLYFKFNTVVLIIIVSLFSNLIIKKQNDKYDNLYKNIKSIEAEGVIVSNKKEKENAFVYKLKVENLNNSSKYKNTYLLVQIKNNKDIQYGDRVKINGEFLEPDVQRNYKGFDYKEYLKTQKIYGTIKASKINVIKRNCGNMVLLFSNRIFLKIENNIRKVIPKEKSDVILGIMLGDTENFDENVKETFTNSSMAHILAVSGMHVTYVTLGAMTIFRPIFGKRKAKIITFFLLILYMLITGLTPSVVRATVMQILVLSSGLVYRKNDTWTAMSISMMVILIYNPFLINSLSVQLSYMGTMGIIVFNKTILYLLKKIKIKNKKYKYRVKKRFSKIIKYARETFSMTLSVQIAILPIIAMNYNTVGIAFLFTSIFLGVIIAPLICIGLIIIICSVFSIQLVKFISIFLNPAIDILIIIAKIGEKLPFSKIYIKTPSCVLTLFFYGFILIQNFIFKIFIPKSPSSFQSRLRNIISLIKYKLRKNKRKWLPFLLIFCIIVSLISVIPQELKIYFVDVGQGDCTLIVTPTKKNILIDGGGSPNDNFDVGKRTVIPYLLDRGITKIDYIFISHFDEDHAKSCIKVMEELRVSNVVITKQIEENDIFRQMMSIVKTKNINVTYVKVGDRIDIDKIKIHILHPSKKLITPNGVNNNSMVCKLEYNSFSMLFTGDIEGEAEAQMIDENIDLKADILKVAHHGSKTSTNLDFLKSVNPKIALIGVGKNNIFGHPNSEIIKRLQEYGARIYRTDEDGEISIFVNGNGRIRMLKQK